ncbi:MAG: HAD-IIIA family hydrolase, partial [Chitinophagales bacterium]
MITTAILLAGGFGTRLQSVIKDLPKPMADISGKPFLEYLFRYLQQQGIDKSILSVGYKWETIQDYFGDSCGSMKLEYSVEDEPLGTGGAILKAVQSSIEEEFFILNGDTFFNIDLHDFYSRFTAQNMETGGRPLLSLALKPMRDFDRYGAVQTSPEHRIISFEEKRFYDQGNINGGIYILHRELFTGMSVPLKFSIEKDLMEKYFAEMKFCGFSFEDYFIDIGIPEDYARAQRELPEMIQAQNSSFVPGKDGTGMHHSFPGKPGQPFTIDKSWTLFLDRDGVINKKIDDDYVRTIDQFIWLDGVQQAMVQLSRIFGKMIIVSNQQGVGKGLMKMAHVETIHNHIIKTIHDLGGKIDGIYFAPQLKSENSPFRKPGNGMALKAKKDFPNIDFSKSMMVG